ncbi:MAG: sulfurtransferase [Chloroflexi bacterium]|nr:sulfurtransferase [Chloroflexota bacterium]
MTTDWLAAHLDNPQVRVVDIRGHVLPASAALPHYYNHHDDYLTSHIPGAVFVDWVHEITDPADPRHAQIADSRRFAEAMRRIGVSAETLVVAYDDASGMFAARLWWALNYYGHARVAILHGGWQQWIAESRPIEAALPVVTPGTFSPRCVEQLYRNGDQVADSLNRGQILIDVRSADEFAGRTSRASRSGHIPGAINLARTDLLDSAGNLLNPEDLRLKFTAAGIDLDQPEQNVVFYCNAGVSASFGLLALRMAGYEGGAVYDGSWKDWGNNPQRPIE